MSKSFAGGNTALQNEHSMHNGHGSRKRRWRAVVIVVASVLSVAASFIFWLSSAGYGFTRALSVAFPPAEPCTVAAG